MSERRYFLDLGPGETRGVVTLDGRPERLMIERAGDAAVQVLGARVVARVTAVEKAQALAFLELGEGPAAVLNLTPDVGRLTQGAAVEVEIRAEARADKGASVKYLGPAEGPPRLLAPGPDVAERLAILQKAGEPSHRRRGPAGRPTEPRTEALRTSFPCRAADPASWRPTRALVALDVDLGAAPGADAKRAARAANFAALATAARALRLKGLGGLVVIDLIGRAHDAPALLAAARAAFAPDGPGVAFGPLGRFGTLEFTIPRRARPALHRLLDDAGAESVLTVALRLIRRLEREAAADPGGRFAALASAEVAEAGRAAFETLLARTGARLTLRGEAGRARGGGRGRPRCDQAGSALRPAPAPCGKPQGPGALRALLFAPLRRHRPAPLVFRPLRRSRPRG